MADVRKEKEPVSGQERVTVAPEFPTVESPRKSEAQENLETKSWIEKIEKRFGRIPQGQPGPQDDQVVVQQPMSNQPPVKLPISQQQIQTNRHVKPAFSIAWLVTWAIRQIKMMARLGRTVEMAQIPEVQPEDKK